LYRVLSVTPRTPVRRIATLSLPVCDEGGAEAGRSIRVGVYTLPEFRPAVAVAVRNEMGVLAVVLGRCEGLVDRRFVDCLRLPTWFRGRPYTGTRLRDPVPVGRAVRARARCCVRGEDRTLARIPGVPVEDALVARADPTTVFLAPGVCERRRRPWIRACLL
jgi:hypothetical protein